MIAAITAHTHTDIQGDRSVWRCGGGRWVYCGRGSVKSKWTCINFWLAACRLSGKWNISKPAAKDQQKEPYSHKDVDVDEKSAGAGL